ncbi:MAG: DUF4974 domain-containing protein [Bacteroidales bacterium]|nr:DUF4974 domain-containing protein [Bacteroidales bacterium]
MNIKNKNIDAGTNRPDAESNFFNKVEIAYAKSKAEVWEMMAARLDEKPKKRTVKMLSNRLWIGLAATILVLAGIFSVMRFYTTTIHNPSGQHLTAYLPDGSGVELNAQSTIKFHPLWWRISREVGFEGEAFFKVKKGKAFQVISTMGKTIVLGTSFNIFSREDEYKVNCFTGKVKVVSVTKNEAVLSPGYHAEIEKGGAIKVFKNNAAKNTASWRNGLFSFTSTPLALVVQEIERQYAVNIRLNVRADYYYTGYFSRKKTVEEVLALLCKTFGLTFEKKSGNDFQINE